MVKGGLDGQKIRKKSIFFKLPQSFGEWYVVRKKCLGDVFTPLKRFGGIFIHGFFFGHPHGHPQPQKSGHPLVTPPPVWSPKNSGHPLVTPYSNTRLWVKITAKFC